MSSLKNRVQLIGHVGNDPEIRSLEGGKRMATLTLATNETYTNANGEKVQDTEWHRITIWGKLVDIAEKYISKGREIAIEGKLTNRSYEQNGEKRYVTEIVAQEILLLGK